MERTKGLTHTKNPVHWALTLLQVTVLAVALAAVGAIFGCEGDTSNTITGVGNTINTNDNDPGRDNNNDGGCNTCDEEVSICAGWECDGKPISEDSCEELTNIDLVEREDCEFVGLGN